MLLILLLLFCYCYGMGLDACYGRGGRGGKGALFFVGVLGLLT